MYSEASSEITNCGNGFSKWDLSRNYSHLHNDLDPRSDHTPFLLETTHLLSVLNITIHVLKL